MNQDNIKKFWKASQTLVQYAFSRESLRHTAHDLTETVAYVQKQDDVKAAFEQARYQDEDRYTPNFWLSSYKVIESDVRSATHQGRKFVEFWLDVDRKARLTWDEMKDSKVSKNLSEKGSQLVNHVTSSAFFQDLREAIDEGIMDEARYLGQCLNTQKELLLSDLRDLLFNEQEKVYLALREGYFPDEERLENDQRKRETLPQESIMERLQERLKPLPQQVQNLLLQSRDKLKETSRQAGYTVLDLLEMEAKDSHPQLAKELAKIRKNCSQRLALNRFQEIAEAVGQIGEQLNYIRNVIREPGLIASR